ncbi:uncharacterized protein LOC119422981 [Nematolebias whitei]|uniref:uncharacterized protein LOC119422981 n=1 Tax=Nematolebias whitei TaxID=451745 RepID=UPI001896BDA5|nr:uncharacterized protein LOC119422981 [Nematolebias whitei]
MKKISTAVKTAHYSQLQLPTGPPVLARTRDLQRRHRQRTQGIHPEPASEVVVRKPKTVVKRCLHSTLYRAFTGPLPDPDILASREKPPAGVPTTYHTYPRDGLSALELVPSRLGPVPQGSLRSHQCPPEKSCAASFCTTWLQTSLLFLRCCIVFPTCVLCPHLINLCTFSLCKCHMKYRPEPGSSPDVLHGYSFDNQGLLLAVSTFRVAYRGSAEEESADSTGSSDDQRVH